MIYHIHKPESALEHKTHKILWDHQIPVSRPGAVLINKKK